ncbi:MAG: tetratricopeptide repeat protein [Fimbriimonadales bacterium]
MDAITSQDPRAGIQLYINQDYAGAEAQLAEAVKVQPGWAEGWSYLGYSQYMQQKYTEAAASLEKAVLMDQENFEARFGLGLVWAAMKRVDAAIACWNETLRLKPGHADAKRSLVGALIYRAQTYLADKDYDHAEADLERAVKIDHQAPQPVVILANHFIDQNMTVRAQKTIKEALVHIPNDAQIQGLAAKLNVKADKDIQVQAQGVQVKQQVQKTQEVPCPACKLPVMEWAAICPHCNTQIKAIPSLFATRNAETPAFQWQDVVYYVVAVIWMLWGALPLVLAALVIFAMDKNLQNAGAPAGSVSGLAAVPLVFGGAKILLGIGLLFQNDFCMSFAKWLCIAGILWNLLRIMIDLTLKSPFAVVFDVLAIGLDGFMIYLLNYAGCD